MKKRYLYSLLVTLGFFAACGNTANNLPDPVNPEIRNGYLDSLYLPGETGAQKHIVPTSMSKRSELDSDNMFLFTVGVSNAGLLESGAWVPDFPSKGFSSISLDTGQIFPIMLGSSYYDSSSSLLFVCSVQRDPSEELLVTPGVLILRKNPNGGFNWLKFIALGVQEVADFDCSGLTVSRGYIFATIRLEDPKKVGDDTISLFATKFDSDLKQLPPTMTPVAKNSDLANSLGTHTGRILNIDVDKPSEQKEGDSIRVFVGSNIVDSAAGDYSGGAIFALDFKEAEVPEKVLDLTQVKTYSARIPGEDKIVSIFNYANDRFIVLRPRSLYKEKFNETGHLIKVQKLNGEPLKNDYAGIGGYGKDPFGRTKDPVVWIMPRPDMSAPKENSDIREYTFTLDD